ncbi:MAG: hypothetical protein PHY16_12740 [Methylobacter sp.]|nr:hypothetical protein [Methylobacter sp.]
MKIQTSILCLIMALLTGCANTPSVKLQDNLGNHHFPITTDDELAQRYFDQGLRWSYAFNHQESIRSFRQAAQFDTNCAMCYWGIAYALGPNINAKMEDGAIAEAFNSVQHAVQLQAKTSGIEKALINALAKRYESKPVTDRSALDKAYADAMREVARSYPDNAEAATLYADALMNQHPWDYWTATGKPKPWTAEIVTALESALRIAPLNPGANHFYIHAVEASEHPERALASADRLGDLMPGAGHMVHMPAHIYIRSGLYDKAAEANRKAVSVDHTYLHDHHSEGIYPLVYVPHNHHFLSVAAANQGYSVGAIEAARSTAAHIDIKAMHQPGMGGLEYYFVMPFYAQVRFGKWDDILQQPAPESDLRFANAIRHYARCYAFLAKGKLEQANNELNTLKAIAKEPAVQKLTFWDRHAMTQILDIAIAVLEGELAAKRNDTVTAIGYLKQSVILEDKLRYDEPSAWYFPVRQSLGAVLLQAGKPHEAEQVYREDLQKNRENGWSLFGLMKSLEAQNKIAGAGEVRQRFKKAWARADIVLTASRIMD